MIIIDFNQIALSNIFIQKLNDEDMIRHMILNSIRMYNKKYRDEYGQMVIACDGMNTWRRDYFPEYKANRKKGRDNDDTHDWPTIFHTLHTVREEIKQNERRTHNFNFSMVSAPLKSLYRLNTEMKEYTV